MTDSTSPGRTLRLGTRGSKLARWQADWVARRLAGLGHPVEIHEIATRGDTEATGPIGEIGTQGVFTKEIQRALLAGQIDLTVHSLKDLPTAVPPEIALAAVPLRESAGDVLVAHSAATLGTLPAGARVGTGSPRRQAQLRYLRPDLAVEPIRGNVDTRLRKLDDREFEAIILAEAGLTRLGLGGRITERITMEAMLPAVGQGALAIECRQEDGPLLAALAALDDEPTRAAVTAERSLMRHVQGGCLAPIGAWGRMEAGLLHLSAVVLSLDGTTRLAGNDAAPPTEADALGRRVAEGLLHQGADRLIAAARID